MKITKETKIAEIIPEGFEYKSITNHTLSENPRITISLNKRPSMDELLEKAKKDYPKGTIFKSVFNQCTYQRRSDGNMYIENNYNIKTNNIYVYYNNKWAEIIETPILKIDDVFLYEGDKYWYIDKNIWKLENYKITNGYTFSNDIDIVRFTTKQSALDFVMEEANRRFKVGSKVNFGYDDSINVIKFIEFGKDIFDENDTIIKIDDNCHIWNESTGFIAEPIKDQGFSSKDEAEIEAHKLGFHVGDRLYSKKYKTFSGTAKEFFFEFDNETPCARYSKGEKWDRLEDVCNKIEFIESSKLMLGEYPVIIENGFIKCKDGIVAIPDWIHWHALLKYVKNIAIDGSSTQFPLGNYKTNYYTGTKTIEIGCIDNATIKQVKKITKAIKNAE